MIREKTADGTPLLRSGRGNSRVIPVTEWIEDDESLSGKRGY